MAMITKTRWSWRRWLARVEGTDMTPRDKELCRRFMELSRDGRQTRRWVQGREIDFKGVGDVTSAMEKARRLGLVIRDRQYPVYLAADEPPPKLGQIRLTRPQRNILVQMLEGEWKLYRINRAGYVNRATSKAEWAWLYNDYGAREIPSVSPRSLWKLGLIEPDGCGHGWPFQWTSRFRAPHWKLCQVRGLEAFEIDLNAKDKYWLPPGDLERVLAILKQGIAK